MNFFSQCSHVNGVFLLSGVCPFCFDMGTAAVTSAAAAAGGGGGFAGV